MRDWLLLGVLCGIGLFLGGGQTRTAQTGEQSRAQATIRALVSPPSQVLATAADGTSDFFAGVFRARSLVEENRRLRDRLQAQRLYAERIELKDRELAGLRALQEIVPPAGASAIPAAIVGYFPYDHRLNVSAGSKQGVRTGLPVLSGYGLLGVVRTVSPHSCEVLLLTSPESRIGAMVASADTRPVVGLLRGEGARALTLEFMDPRRDPVHTADLVVTTGFSDKIPRGLLIGRVTQIEDYLEVGSRRASVLPSAAVGQTRDVVILR